MTCPWRWFNITQSTVASATPTHGQVCGSKGTEAGMFCASGETRVGGYWDRSASRKKGVGNGLDGGNDLDAKIY